MSSESQDRGLRGWISVKDRLPNEETEHVLLRVDRVDEQSTWDIGLYEHVDGRWIHRLSQRYACTVTHWMPLPDPPAALATPAEPAAQTRFDEFDDENHPFRKWWNEHGQYMMSGGGRRESIWAARGWIAREQFGEGAPVTGESMHEDKPAAPTPAQPEPEAGTGDVVERMQRAESELAMVDEALARRPAVALSPNRYTAICAAFNMASRTEKAEAMEKHWKMHYERLAVAREGCYTLEQIEKAVVGAWQTSRSCPQWGHPDFLCAVRQRLSAGTERVTETCDYRKPECSNTGLEIEGRWYCVNHLPVRERSGR